MPGSFLASVPTPPSTFDGLTEALAVLVLLVVFAMFRKPCCARRSGFMLSSPWPFPALAALLGASQHAGELYALAGLSRPEGRRRPRRGPAPLAEAEVDLAGSHRFGVATAFLVGVVVSVAGFLAVGDMHFGHSGSHGLPVPALGAALATVLVSFVLVMFRADVVSQAVGFFSMENGVSVASLVVAARMPLILEVGFLFDLLVAVVAFGILMRAHHRRSASLSTETLDQLRG